ncbi:MAG: hypothetical protein OEW39_04220 [Deltaproteobacteria bacterium]|nr:hypothetical protein [Deltaproteobacteria bacterium]
MNRLPILSLALTAALIGGLFLLFPKYAAWASLFILLVLLVLAQAVLLRRHLFPILRGRDPLVMSGLRPPPVANRRRAGPEAAAPTPTPGPEKAAGPAAPQAESAPGAGPTGLDSSLFSRFRAHLEQAESGGIAPAPVAPAEPVTLDQASAAVEDQVQISTKARGTRGYPQNAGVRGSAQKNIRAPSEDNAAPEEDIFADVRTAPLAERQDATPGSDKGSRKGSPKTQGVTPDPVESEAPGDTPFKAPAPEPTTEAPSPVNLRPEPAAPPKTPLPPPAGLSPRRSQPAETPVEAEPVPSPSPAGAEIPPSPPVEPPPHPGSLVEEARTLLRMARERMEKGDLAGAKAALENYLSHLAAAPNQVSMEAHQMRIRLLVWERHYSKALEYFEGLLKADWMPDKGRLGRQVEALLTESNGEGVDHLRVSLLVRILALFRQQRDREGMNETYALIESAQERVGDEQKLIQYLKNHLELRRAMGDVPGQLDLIDRLGNRCYKLGLRDEAKGYYEMGLRLRTEAGEESGPPPGPSAPGGSGT